MTWPRWARRRALWKGALHLCLALGTAAVSLQELVPDRYRLMLGGASIAFATLARMCAVVAGVKLSADGLSITRRSSRTPDTPARRHGDEDKETA